MKLFIIAFMFFYAAFGQAEVIIKADTASSAMVVAAHPKAVKTGIRILNSGGNAVDAAVAMAFVICVVEPYASGLGGGGGMLIFDKTSDRFHYLDYYMQTSEKADTAFSDDEKYTPRSICVPGTPSGLVTAVKKYGVLPLKEVIAPAIKIAKNGIVVNDKFYHIILDRLDVIMKYQSTKRIYLENDFPVQPGDTLYNPELVSVLQGLAKYGEDYFYRGEFTRQAVNDIQANGGFLTLDDFNIYEALFKEAPHIKYRNYEIYSSAPPQSGVTLLEILNMFELAYLPLYQSFDSDANTIHLLCSIIRRADADRYYYLGDPRYFNIPVAGLTAEQYARIRFGDILPYNLKYNKDEDVPKGDPIHFLREKESRSFVKKENDSPHTTHISVIDSDGNAVSLTQTLGYFFGSGFSSQGVTFNNSMVNFYNKPSPNRLGPRRRPLSTISPTIVKKDNKIKLIIGTPGGGRLFNVMAQLIIRLLDFNEDPLKAIYAPRFSIRTYKTTISYESRFENQIIESLKKIGYKVIEYSPLDGHFGGVQLIYFDEEQWKYIGVSDPRRTGDAEGIN